MNGKSPGNEILIENKCSRIVFVIIALYFAADRRHEAIIDCRKIDNADMFLYAQRSVHLTIPAIAFHKEIIIQAAGKIQRIGIAVLLIEYILRVYSVAGRVINT